MCKYQVQQLRCSWGNPAEMLEQGWAEMSWVPALRGRAGTWPCTIPKCDFWRAWGELPPSSFVSAVIIYESTSVLKTLKWTFFKPFLCQNHIPECTKNFYLFFFFLKFCFPMSKWFILSFLPPDNLVLCLQLLQNEPLMLFYAISSQMVAGQEAAWFTSAWY